MADQGRRPDIEELDGERVHKAPRWARILYGFIGLNTETDRTSEYDTGHKQMGLPEYRLVNLRARRAPRDPEYRRVEVEHETSLAAGHR